MRGPFLFNHRSPSTTMKKHIFTLTAIILLAGCSSATAPKALQSATVAKATSSLPNAHGCYSSFNEQPLGLNEENGDAAQAYGPDFVMVLDDLTSGQCVQLLSGGVSSTGGQTVSLNPVTGSDPETEGFVTKFCQEAASGGFTDQMAIMYTPSGPYPFLTAP
jgi:hypothetical protein